MFLKERLGGICKWFKSFQRVNSRDTSPSFPGPQTTRYQELTAAITTLTKDYWGKLLSITTELYAQTLLKTLLCKNKPNTNPALERCQLQGHQRLTTTQWKRVLRSEQSILKEDYRKKWTTFTRFQIWKAPSRLASPTSPKARPCDVLGLNQCLWQSSFTLLWRQNYAQILEKHAAFEMT